MNLKKTLIGLGIAAYLAGSLFAQNKTSNSKESAEKLHPCNFSAEQILPSAKLQSRASCTTANAEFLKETKMGKSLVVYFSLAGEQYKSHRLRAA